MRYYESIFIVDPDVTEERVDTLISELEAIVETTGGRLHRIGRSGRKRLTYKVKKKQYGQYVAFYVEAPPATVEELERRYRYTEIVLKYMTVKLEAPRTALRSKFSSSVAASGPIISCTWPTISPSIAAWLNTRPAMAMEKMSRGAMEKTM